MDILSMFDLKAVIENWVSGLAGAVAAGVSLWVIKSIHAAWLNKQFPVAGSYMTQFEDIENGEKVVSLAPATLKQKGRELKGKTFIDNKKWNLEGEITDGGYIYGYYSASSPHDQGVGNFFLEIKGSGQLEGIWSGFDSENKLVTSGKYSFRKIPKYKIRKATQDDMPYLFAVSSGTLGEGYVENLLECEGAKDKKDVLFLVAEVEGNVIGYCFAYKLEKTDWDSLMKNRMTRLSPDMRHALKDGKLGVIQTLAVSPEFQGCGIGSALLEQAMERMNSMGSVRFVSLAWKSGKGVNIQGVLERHKFQKVTELENFWTEESVKIGYECPYCGHPCHCSAVVYTK